MRRPPLSECTFAIDVLACSDCGGRVRLLATIDDPAVIEKILRHLGLPLDPPLPTPARDPPWLVGSLPSCDAGPASPSPSPSGSPRSPPVGLYAQPSAAASAARGEAARWGRGRGPDRPRR